MQPRVLSAKPCNAWYALVAAVGALVFGSIPVERGTKQRGNEVLQKCEIHSVEMEDKLLDHLFKLSGSGRSPATDDDFVLVRRSLLHENPNIRERAVFTGGLRWMDPRIIDDIVHILAGNEEPDENVLRLMIETVVSFGVERLKDNEFLELIGGLIDTYGTDSFIGKVAFVGLCRLKGLLTKKEFAGLDYDVIHVPADWRIQPG